MAISLDPLRYGIRALDEMAREQASVALPPPSKDEVFSPHTTLRPAPREGSALSLRVLTDAPDDATSFVLGEAGTLRLAPIPPRAASLFEAHAALLAADRDETQLTLGFPLTTFVQQGSARAAPLFSRGSARARWMAGEKPWTLAAGFQNGALVALPDALVLEADEDEPYTLHAGVWHFLFGLDGDVLAAIAHAGRSSLGALVRAATRALASGGEDLEEEETPANAQPSREDLAALTEAAMARAPRSRALRCHPHGLLMLPPRGDPTSGLRGDLGEMLGKKLPPRGPLAVYLGARGASASGEVFTTGATAPTPSQLEAARAFEGSTDIVAVCGPPGCGKTALLHHVAAQTVVACALGNVWSSPPSRLAMWPLVVASTNNAAVDHALAPFLSRQGLTVGIRLGNRRLLAEATAGALAHAMGTLEAREGVSLGDARKTFEERAAPVRAYLRERQARGAASARRGELERHGETLRAVLATLPDGPAPSVERAVLASAKQALEEQAEAAARLPGLHLESAKGSVRRAAKKWDRAIELRAPRIAAALEALGLALPFRTLDEHAPHEDILRQEAAIKACIAAVDVAVASLDAPAMRKELATLDAELAAAPAPAAPPPLDPGLYDAALAVRDAWARVYHAQLLPRLAAARDAARGDRSAGRGKPLPLLLRELAPLFPVAGCTLLSMRASFPLERDVVDRLVIDEAAQCAPIYAAPALARARRAMFTGDVAQLPPVYTLDARVDERLAHGLDDTSTAPFRMSATSTCSAQGVAEQRARTRLSLVEHFRSQPAIVSLASRWSGYALDVRTPTRSLADVSPRLRAAVEVLSVKGVGARAREGVVNEAEAGRAIEIVTDLVADGVEASDVAVLSPFVGQSLRIERELVARGLANVVVSTVHRLQGGERRVVVFSVTATERRHLRWLAERPHLLHVATSRAQDHLIVLVDPEAARREGALGPLAELVTQ